RPRPFGIGPADHHELLAVQAFHFQPQAAIAGGVRRVASLRNDPFEIQRARLLIESPAAPDLVIAELKRRSRVRQQRPEPFLPVYERSRADGLAIEMQQIE